ncbi:MAG: dUTP diphosphatase [Hyphomicrobiaceae bacterium]|nr:MAG: dUTP diphosphatase [Hyphomicrobiaceae bacterium]
MLIKALHPDFIMPTKGTDRAGAIDLYMPVSGWTTAVSTRVGLGFAAAIPAGHVGLIVPRSGVGTKNGLELNNTVGVIDADYRGEWVSWIRTKNGQRFEWNKGDRILQAIIVPVTSPTLKLVDELDDTSRGAGGFGSTGV